MVDGRGAGALADSVAYLACAEDQRLVVEAAPSAGGWEGKEHAGKKKKGRDAVLTGGNRGVVREKGAACGRGR